MLLREMQIQNPTAIMIARTAVAQDDVTGCATGLCASLPLAPWFPDSRGGALAPPVCSQRWHDECGVACRCVARVPRVQCLPTLFLGEC